MKVVVKGTNVVYSEATINMVLSLHNVGDPYIHLLENSDDVDLDVLKDSLCNSSTRWIDADKSSKKTVRRMDFHPDVNVWYQFIKHSLRPTAHSETVNKDKLMLLHYITSFSVMNVDKIILQEI